MVSLQALDPIWVDFPMPEQNVGKLRVGQTIELTVGTYPGKVFTGTVASLDARVSQDTRTLLTRGTLANPDRTLLPGMFANVAVLAGARGESRDRAAHGRHLQPLRRQRLRPEETRRPAGTRQAGGHGLCRRAPLRKKRPGQEDRVAITTGLKEGEQIVTTGQVKLFNGGQVKVDNSQALVPPAVRPFQ